MFLDRMPVLAFSGGRGAGTIPLLRRLLPLLAGQGVKAALVVGGGDLPRELAALCRVNDLVLVAGGEDLPLTRALLLGPGEESLPPVPPVVLAVPFQSERQTILLAFIAHWLASRWRQTPVYACLLIGGQSRRMGRPKHLIRQGGRTWLERTVELLRTVAAEVVVAGRGESPLAGLHRLEDVTEVAGPLAGLAAAMRWRPWVSWLLVACDLPDLDLPALAWLLAARQPGVWAVIPRLGDDLLQPLLAYYDFRLQPQVEEQARRGEARIGRLAAAEKAAVLTPPERLWPAWRNVNYAHELAAEEGGEGID